EQVQQNLDRIEYYLDELESVLTKQDRTVPENEEWRYRDYLQEWVDSTRRSIIQMRNAIHGRAVMLCLVTF
ncbi:MAG: hypothetical protein R3281_14600, partial [Balneolaceae bacterium]|nr:hypothetical protein [Balneolaceae bacterium]